MEGYSIIGRYLFNGQVFQMWESDTEGDNVPHIITMDGIKVGETECDFYTWVEDMGVAENVI